VGIQVAAIPGQWQEFGPLIGTVPDQAGETARTNLNKPAVLPLSNVFPSLSLIVSLATAGWNSGLPRGWRNRRGLVTIPAQTSNDKKGDV
jgi:hypothetical protein